MAKDPITRIQTLEKHLTKKSDSFNPNPLLELVALARHDDPQVVHSAIWALHRVFIKLIGDGRLGRAVLRKSDSDAENEAQVDVGGEGWQVREWIMKRLGEYLDVLGGLLRDTEEGLRVSRAIPYSLKSKLTCT
jgi:U3 small nucleolar RNA-associated protein 19